MIQNIFNFLNTPYKARNDSDFDNIDPNLVRYFKTEYGKNWQSALTEYLYKKGAKNDKKAA